MSLNWSVLRVTAIESPFHYAPRATSTWIEIGVGMADGWLYTNGFCDGIGDAASGHLKVGVLTNHTGCLIGRTPSITGAG